MIRGKEEEFDASHLLEVERQGAFKDALWVWSKHHHVHNSSPINIIPHGNTLHNNTNNNKKTQKRRVIASVMYF